MSGSHRWVALTGIDWLELRGGIVRVDVAGLDDKEIATLSNVLHEERQTRINKRVRENEFPLPTEEERFAWEQSEVAAIVSYRMRNQGVGLLEARAVFQYHCPKKEW